MSSTAKTQKYPLWTVLPPDLRNAHLNGCRTPGCRNFNVAPVVVPGVVDPNYRVERDGTDHRLRCSACGRRFSIFAVRAHALELDRLETRSGALIVPSCPKPACPNHGLPVTRHPKRYGTYGSTTAGRTRYLCRRCRTTFVFEDDHKALINKRIFQTLIRFLMNAVAIRGQMRMTQKQAAEIYRRLPYIWRKFVQYEEYKLQRFFAMKKNRHIRLHLSLDAQDQLVNWWSRDRRDPVQLSCITTAENLSGFILRTDLNFDGSTGNAAEHFEELLLAGDYGLPKAMSLHERYEEKAFLKAVIWGLRRAKKGLAPSDRRKSTTATPLAINSQRRQMINTLLFQAEQQLKTAVPGVVDDVEGSPPDGVIVKRPYTALAHLAALDRLLPEEARIHLSTDRDGTLVAAALTAFRDRIVANTVNMTVVTFAREMTIDQKVARIARFNQRLDAFVRLNSLQNADPILVRQAFIATYARKLKPISGIPGTFWSVPVQTPYEPDKRVGIVHARLRSTTASQTWQQWELLDRASLHASDTFFNYVRSRVSYLTRSSDTKAGTSTYAPRRPYRPDLLRMVYDIVRVYYNFCEPRRRRKARDVLDDEDKLAPLDPSKLPKVQRKTPVLPDRNPSSFRDASDRTPKTPAMRFGVTRAPTRVSTILYGNWLR